jgi:hypothetical protein
MSSPSQEEARVLEALLDDFRQSLVSQGKSTGYTWSCK